MFKILLRHIMDKKVFLLEKVKSMVDLGVHFDSNLMFWDHVRKKLIEYTVL